MSDALEQFSPLTRAWFRDTFGKPTPPQAQGWLPIQRGELGFLHRERRRLFSSQNLS